MIEPSLRADVETVLHQEIRNLGKLQDVLQVILLQIGLEEGVNDRLEKLQSERDQLARDYRDLCNLAKEVCQEHFQDDSMEIVDAETQLVLLGMYLEHERHVREQHAARSGS